MRLSEKYQPTTLDEIVGQPAVINHMKVFAAKPYRRGILFEGRQGTGKSATAQALLEALGVNPLYGLEKFSAARLGIEEVERLFCQTFRYRPMAGSPWNVLLIEEMELLPSANVVADLKNNLSEQNWPMDYPRLIVLATSNNVIRIDPALLDRFDPFPFSAGPTFADACGDRLQWIWEQEVGDGTPMPMEVAAMGWGGEAYSMRRALAALGAAVEMHQAAQAREEAMA